MRPHRGWRWTVAVVLLIGSGCATSGSGTAVAGRRRAKPSASTRRGIHAFEVGDYDRAALELENEIARSPEAASDPAVVLPLALSHAAPGHPAHDLERARELLRSLASSGDERNGEATALLGLLDQQAVTISRLVLTQRELGLTRAELNALCAEMATQEIDLSQAKSSAADQKRRVRELERKLSSLEQRARRLQEELEQLKKIDLDRSD